MIFILSVFHINFEMIQNLNLEIFLQCDIVKKPLLLSILYFGEMGQKIVKFSVL